MATDNDIREIRGHVMTLVGQTGRIEARLDGVDERLGGIDETLRDHARPCKDMLELKPRIEELHRKAMSRRKEDPPQEENGGPRASLGASIVRDRSLLGKIIDKVAAPIAVAVAALISGIAGYLASRG